jgi:ATP-dependent DNA helicase RecG
MNFIRRNAAASVAEVESYLQAGQNERVAFLPAKATARTIAETLASLANANGGVALLGVTSSGAPQKGIDAPTLCDLALQASLHTDPPLILPSAQVVETERGALVAVQAPPGLPHVYSLQGVFLTRTGAHNRPLTTAELRSLLLDRGESGFESQQVEGAALADLDPQRIERYLDRAMLSAAEDPLHALSARGCLAQDEHGQTVPTVAGLLLFGANPAALSAQRRNHLRALRRRQHERRVRAPGHRRPAGRTIRQAETFVTSNMRRGMRITGFAREETSEYPVPVVREALVNAVAHRDYSIRGEGIRLLMFSDRLEVYSPGRLPGHVTLANLKDERYSRNEAIVAVLSDLGYIERLGYGIDRMIAAMRDAGLLEPIFEETAAGFA